MWTACLVSAVCARADAGAGRITVPRRRSSASRGGAPCNAATRYCPSLSHRYSIPNLASQMRVAFASMASNTGSNEPGELEMTRRTSEVAACCSTASVRCFCASASSRRYDFELLLQIGARLAHPVSALPRLRSGRTKLATTCSALRALARQGHPAGTSIDPASPGPPTSKT